jgi:hypothetical protein
MPALRSRLAFFLLLGAVCLSYSDFPFLVFTILRITVPALSPDVSDSWQIRCAICPNLDQLLQRVFVLRINRKWLGQFVRELRLR